MRICQADDCNESIEHKRSDARYCSARCRTRSYYRVNPRRDKYTRRWKLRNQYGISLAEYDEMLESQGGVCAICGEGCTTGRRLAVDHCHDTGDVRGLLCYHCNTGLGKLKDSPRLLSKAITYLTQ